MLKIIKLLVSSDIVAIRNSLKYKGTWIYRLKNGAIFLSRLKILNGLLLPNKLNDDVVIYYEWEIVRDLGKIILWWISAGDTQHIVLVLLNNELKSK